MCGIAGVAHADGRPVSLAGLEDMAAAIEHRGPDEGGRHVSGSTGLAIRRLRIIDLVTGGQPISNEDGTVWVVFNGEIYGYRSLRDELLARGHTFRTQTDTECVVHAYEEYGDDCVTKLRGMFAFALWDERRQRLLLARDRLGKKPLVYAEISGSLYFASEIQALLRVPELPRDLDLGALGDYLAYGYVPAPATIFSAIRKLPPAHTLVWEGGRSSRRRYWRLRYAPKLHVDENEALEELERRLTEAVRLRLIADVPLGVLLSGGVDSSLVTALMATQSSTRVRTFSVGFEDTSYDELAHARRVAERYDTEHHEFVVTLDAASVLPTLVRHYGEPYADSSAIPTFYVAKLARSHVTVALNGDGGDEAFAGYDRCRAMAYAARLRSLPTGPALIAAGRALTGAIGGGHGLPGRAERFLQAAALPARERYARWVSAIPNDLLPQLLRTELAATVGERRSYAVERAFDDAAGLEPVDRVLSTDTQTYLPDDLLVKMDIASMANSLETRSPLLDHELLEFVAALPVDLKLRGGTRQKYLLKRLARRYVPGENIDRPKQGFGVPVGSWLRAGLSELVQDTLLANDARSSAFVVPEVVERLWAEHTSGQRDRTLPLWTLLMLELWMRDVGDRRHVA